MVWLILTIIGICLIWLACIFPFLWLAYIIIGCWIWLNNRD